MSDAVGSSCRLTLSLVGSANDLGMPFLGSRMSRTFPRGFPFVSHAARAHRCAQVIAQAADLRQAWI
jgi:hypothetical protein